MNDLYNDRKRCEDEKYQINILENLFGNITRLSPRAKNILDGKIYTREELKNNSSILHELGIINGSDRIPDLDCESYDNDWHFPMTLKYQIGDGGAQSLAVDNVISTMKQATKKNSSDKTCLIVYVGGNHYTKLRGKYRNSFLYENELSKKFNIYQFLSAVSKDLNIKCKI